MTDSSQTENIWAAFAAAQAEFAPIRKNGTISFGNTSYAYADLNAVLDATKPALNAHGLALTQRAEIEGASIKIETLIFNAAGDSISSGVLVMPIDGGKGLSRIQCVGSAMTYARRYSLSAFLGIAADDDTDGNSAGGSQGKKAEPFVLTQQMIDAAKAAASTGVGSYKTYYQSRPIAERTELAKTGWHKRCYEAAKAADAANGTRND